MLCRGEAVYAVDLFLDVLVRSDGITHGVYDEEDFTHALERGWLSEHEAAGARAGLRELVDLIESNALVDFLTDVHPFASTLAPEAPAMEHVSLSETTLLGPRVRPSW